MKQLLYIIFSFFYLSANSQVSGFVFRDYNGNGTKNNTTSFNEPYVAGIVVTATISNGTIFTATTNSSGAYSFSAAQIPAGTKVRIEFTGIASGDINSFTGTDNGTNVQFITAPSATANYGINSPGDYWDNIGNSLPPLMVVNSRRGTTNGYYKDQYTILEVNNNTSGPYNPATAELVTADTSKRHALHAQTGSLFGLAAQSKQERFFASAFLKRASGFGPQGPGGIYVLGKSGASWSMAGGFTLQGVAPSNGGTALDFGAVTRVSSPASDDNYISDNKTWSIFFPQGSDTRDIDAFSKSGTMSYGDIEADPESDKLFMINMFQKRLIVFNASAITSTYIGASAATLANFTTAYNITSLPGCPSPTGSGNNLRPFAIKIYKGKGYLGVVSDASSTQNSADLVGYILQFDIANIGAGFTTVLTIPFNNFKDIYDVSHWKPWISTWAQTGGTTFGGPNFYMQPMISGIEFNEDGSMTIGIRDRWGDQGGTYELNPISGASSGVQTVMQGDIVHACKTSAGWALEGTPGSCNQPSANINADVLVNDFGFANSAGNTDKEWYSDRSGDSKPESSQGSVAKLMGTDIVVSTVYDPMGSGETPGSNYWTSHGLMWNRVSTGLKTQVARLVGINSSSLDKANAMGDIEFLMKPQPIQVGNRIWFDANADGIQDPGEPAGGPAGTIVTLRSPGVDGVFNNADDQTWTTTTDANGNYYFSTLSTADNRKPASWTAIGNTILPGYDYRIEVPISQFNIVTLANVSSNSKDNIDNDAVSTGGRAVISFNTNVTNHSYDIGISSAPLPLKLTSFTAQLTQQDKASLVWVTEQEENVSHFEVEKSMDGINFNTAYTVKAKGTGNDKTNYQQIDNIPASFNIGLMYYRLKSVDNDGKFYYSEIRIVRLSAANNKKLTVFPNPATSELNITIPTTWQQKKVTYQIMNMSGQLLKQIVATSGSQTQGFDIADMSTGTYTIKVICEGAAITQKFLKL